MRLREWLREQTPTEVSRSLPSFRVLFILGVVLGLVAAPTAGLLVSYLNDPVSQSGEVAYSAANGPTATIVGDYNFSGTKLFPDSNTVRYVSDQGNVTLSSQGDTSVTVTQIEGEWTNTTSLDVSSTDLTVNPDDKQQVVVGGDADRLSITSMQVDDDRRDFYYGGSSGSTTLVIHGLQSNTEIGAVDTSTGVVLDSNTTNSSGALVLSVPNSNHTVELTTNSLEEGTPVVSNPTPTGELSNTPDELSVDVNDSDFPDDTISVDFYLNGTHYGSASLSSNGTASVGLGNLSSGQHDWYVVAEDSYGRSERSSTYEFSTPDELLIYNESSPDTLINNETVTVEFFEEDGERVFSRNTTDGSVNLTGLPATETFVVKATVDGYYDRTVILKSLASQHSLYLLHENATSVEVRFTLTDKTGEFPEDSTRLYVKAPLAGNNSTNYQTIAADEFGVQGVTTNLREDERYRLVVENKDGEQRVLGTYTAVTSETVPLEIGEIVYDVDDDFTGYQWNASMYGPEGNKSIEFQFKDYAIQDSNLAEDLQVTIYERGNESNVIYDQTKYGDVESYSLTQPLTAAQSNNTWVVEWQGERGDTVIDGRRVVGPGQKDLIGGLDQIWKSIASVGLLMVVGLLFSPANSGTGVVVIAIVGGILWFIGFLPAVVGGPAAVIALVISVLYRTNQNGGYPA